MDKCFLKLLLIICLQILFEGNGFCGRVRPLIDHNPQKKVSIRPLNWRYSDNLSEEIRTYDFETHKWYGSKHAIISCQRGILQRYDSKARRILNQTEGQLEEVFTNFKVLENAKNHSLLACSKAFQRSLGNEKGNSGNQPKWKYNDTVSQEIRKYDRLRNRWVNEKEATLNCQRQAEINYETSQSRYSLQNDSQGLQDMKALKDRTFKACERAFERYGSVD